MSSRKPSAGAEFLADKPLPGLFPGALLTRGHLFPCFMKSGACSRHVPEVTRLSSGWAVMQTPVPQLQALYCQTPPATHTFPCRSHLPLPLTPSPAGS